MNIAVIGSGSIGSTLGRKWARAGHSVVFGSRTPEGAEMRALLSEIGRNATSGTVAEATASAEVVLFAIPGRAMDETSRAAADGLAGKTLIDATNRVGAPTMNSLELLRSIAPGSSVYRASNSLGWENFEQPVVGGIQADLFFAGPAGPASPTVERLIAEIGLKPVYLGGPEKSALVDALTQVWFTLAFERKAGRRLALKVLSE